jgi:hypothetical protein
VEPVRLRGLEEDTIERCASLAAVMCHYSHRRPEFLLMPSVLDLIEDCLGLPIFPCRRMRILFDRKDLQCQILSHLGLPSVPAYCTDNYSRFVQEVSHAVFPIVIKYVNGAGSSQVRCARSKEEALWIGRAVARRREVGAPAPLTRQARLAGGRAVRSALTRIARATRRSPEQEMEHLVPWRTEDISERLPLLYWQPFIEGTAGDIRVTVIGDKAFTFRRANRPGDFRASVSGRIDYGHADSDVDAVEIAFDAERRLDVGNVAFDFLRGPDGRPKIVEMSYGYLSSAVERCPGHWLRDHTWKEGSRKPEDLHVEWFLNHVAKRSHASPTL